MPIFGPARAHLRSMPHATHAGVTPPPGLMAAARNYVDVHGLVRSARDLGTSRQSLSALLAGLRVRRGTILVVGAALGWPGDRSTPPPLVA